MSDGQEPGEPDAIHAAQDPQDEVEYSEDFAAMILAQEERGFEEIDVDDLLALLERMIIEARRLGPNRQ
ncbi:hypothetical protein C4Q28_23615 [Pseudomonas sp. SWI6]|uniref:Uncharacterized protein n=1 Tax=Pseudomonas taiwanensis TaxID=470150 RepID=A0ABR6V322_9PSED|nr:MULTISPECIES: hypothetical protein [Pseudomonas]AGZ33476.1 hypothetical protein PVLB_03345 [Pseudomonas sp. VLB120]AVD84940.1 hypothetical protein C4Q28_23615 [Pseudomonas sp. SWI6]MBC3474902.1 hypothetical protein [Pseudomonas taiwanensis]MPS98012.1 hypothetical protein [Pseudomonas sp.]QQZ36958.1 hypothetical protein IF103_03180 [Pseudomonas sp. SK2]